MKYLNLSKVSGAYVAALMSEPLPSGAFVLQNGVPESKVAQILAALAEGYIPPSLTADVSPNVEAEVKAKAEREAREAEEKTTRERLDAEQKATQKRYEEETATARVLLLKSGTFVATLLGFSPVHEHVVVHLKGLADARTVADALNGGAKELPTLRNGYRGGEGLVREYLSKPKVKLQHIELAKHPKYDSSPIGGWHDVKPHCFAGGVMNGTRHPETATYFSLYREVSA